MAFKEVSDLNADTTVSLGGSNRKTGKKNPSEIEGYYLGRREVADAKKKSGKSFIYIFQTAKGNVGVWGKTDMDRKMDAVTVGNMTRVSFDKMVPTPNGEMYKYKVAQDPDNSIDLGTTSGPSRGNDDYGSDYESEETEEGGDDDDEAAYAPSPNLGKVAAGATLSPTDRQAKVAALLSKKSK